MPKVVIMGKGVDVTPTFQGVLTPIPILYNHYEKKFVPALLQGSITARSMTDGLTIGFPALYGFYAPAKSDKKSVPETGLTFADIRAKYCNDDQFERSAFAYGREIFDKAWDELEKVTTAPDVESNKWSIIKHDKVEDTMEVVMDVVQAMQDKIIDTVENEYFRQGTLLERAGTYRWMGLSVEGGNHITTPLIIPKLISGKVDLFMSASTVPQGSDGRAITPHRENISHALMSGLIHGFEGRDRWTKTTAIRAALFHYIYNDSLNVETLLAAAARAGVFPRLGSVIETPGRTAGAWRYLASLALSLEYFRKHYVDSIQKPVGTVEYLFSGSGVASVLEEKVKRYFSSAFINVEQGSGDGGVVFFPAQNTAGSSFYFDFVHERPGAWNGGPETDGCTKLIISESPRAHCDFDPSVAFITKDLILTESEEERTRYIYRPVTIEPSRTVRLYSIFVGAGLTMRQILIKDVFDNQKYQASELLQAMMVGWPPAYAPKYLILTDQNVPSRISNFLDVDVDWATNIKELKLSKQANAYIGQGFVDEDTVVEE